ncbi:MAG: Ger(x)C family spore germination protein [Firmicutes bacterium]|nr:Ger(x)C family spore germination protein [Bacillota bacterium]
MRYRIGAVLCGLLLLLTGCWDYRELEFIDFVLGIGIDQVEPDFKLVAEVIKVEGVQETEFAPEVLTTGGRTFLSSARSLEKEAGIRLFWAHAQVLIIGEEVARREVLPAVEFAIRDPEFRTSLLLFVAKECSAEDIFKSKSPIANSISDHLRNVAEFHRRVPTCFIQKLWEFRQTLQMDGISAVLPTIRLLGEGPDQIPVLEGSAAFRQGQMVGFLDGEETRIYSLLKGKTDRGPLVVEWEGDSEKGKITYVIRSNQVRIKAVEQEKRPKISIDVELGVELMELGSLTPDFEDPAVLSELERGIGAEIEGQIKNLITKAQTEFKSDIFGFGLRLKQRIPKIWRLYEEDWEQVFSDLEVDVQVLGRLVATGVLSKPLRMRE